MAAESTSWISELLPPVSVLMFAINWFFWSSKEVYKRRIDSTHPEDRIWLRDRFKKNSIFESYKHSLIYANDKLNDVFGDPWTVRSLKVCAAVAFLYPFFLFCLSWAISGNGSLGGITVLPDVAIHIRLILAPLITIGVPSALFVIIRNTIPKTNNKIGINVAWSLVIISLVSWSIISIYLDVSQLAKVSSFFLAYWWIICFIIW